ncbi:MAG TPA: VOC family protein [Acidimicrobiales bacterium]|nr:VOC family protein [Acidimicrobiales bacterium]
MLTWEQVTIDAHDPVAWARWWAEALRRVEVNDDSRAFEIQPAPEQYPGSMFLRVPEAQSLKNSFIWIFDPTIKNAKSLASSR